MVYFIILCLFLLLSASFSAAEVAFISLTNAKIEAMIKRKLPRAELIKKLKSNPRRLLIVVLIGNNVVNIGSASLATIVASTLFDSAVFGITTGVMTLIILIFGEILPKSYAVNHQKRLAIFFAPLLLFFYYLFFPVVVIFEWFSALLTGDHVEEKVSEEELKALVKAGVKQGTIEHEEDQMIHRLFALNDITAEDIMIPRVQMISIGADQSIDKAAGIIERHPFSRFPIIDQSPDRVIGFVHSRDVLLAYHTDAEHTPIKKIIRPIVVVPKQMRIDDIMREFQKTRTHMAIVVDEYGGTEGIVTFEDIIEELLGDIEDESDIDNTRISRIDTKTILVAGDTDIRDINRALKSSLPGDDFDTIAEVLLDAFHKLPQKGDQATLGNAECTVEEVKKRRIQKVKVVRLYA